LENDISAGIVAEAALLAKLLRSSSEEGRVQAVEVLGNFAARIDADRVAIVEAGALPLLVALLRGRTEEGRRAAARMLWKFAESNDANRAAIVEAGTVPPLVALLSGGSE
jgi:hypothetical protein